MRRPRNNRWLPGWAKMVAAALLLAASSGCGVKAPPVPPNRPPLPEVTELGGTLEGNEAMLAWRATGGGGDGIRSFDVFRAQSRADQASCAGCPLIFQKVGRVELTRDADRYVFSEPVAAGFIYTYKVQPVGPGGAPGPESNRVVIDRSSP